MANRRIALFGGTFDPVHRGHTEVARAAAKQIGAERVVFIPARRSPLKGFHPMASDEDRLNMIRLAIEGTELFNVSDCELRRAAPSYTLDTVRQLQDAYGAQTTLHWLLGADAIAELAHWHRVEDLIDICNLTVMYRGGYEAPSFERIVSLLSEERIEKLRANVVRTPTIEVSSTEVRRRLARGENVSDMLAPAVWDYIRSRGLYART